MNRGWWFVLVALLVALAAAWFIAARQRRPALAWLDAPIAFYEAKLDDDPGLYEVRAQLGEAILERARLTHDPADVRRARDELQRSIATQANFRAYKAMTALCNFSHRFEEALKWADLAREAYPEDTGVTAQQVEALLGLGRIDDAEALVNARATDVPDFYLTAAQARIHSAAGRVDEAVAGFVRAGEIARRQNARPLVLWANVSAAAAYIDSDRAPEAKPYLDAAAAIDRYDPLLRVHEAEFLAAAGNVQEALAIYDALIEQLADPVIHAAASRLHAELGNEREARRHFRKAEAGFRRALDAGEIFTLDALARLYLDAGANLEEARSLAQRNLEFKRDADARRVLEEIEKLLREQR